MARGLWRLWLISGPRRLWHEIIRWSPFRSFATKLGRRAMSAFPSLVTELRTSPEVRFVPIPDMRTTSRRRAPIRLIGTDEARIPHHSKNTSDAPSLRHARYPERFRISLDVLGSTKVLPPLYKNRDALGGVDLSRDRPRLSCF